MLATRNAFALAKRAPVRITRFAPRTFSSITQRCMSYLCERLHKLSKKSQTTTDATVTKITDESRQIDAEKSKYAPKSGESQGKLMPFDEVKAEEDLLPPGAAPGTVPTDLEQATGLERLEILGKMQGIDIFDMKPLPADRLGTLKDPIVVRSAGEELQCGCTGVPADSHIVRWVVVSRDRPHERCDECGSVYKMEYIGPPDDPHDHGHHHHGYSEPKTMADYVKQDYWYR